MAQPSNRTIPEVIRGMTIEQVCRLTRIAATPRILPLPLGAWAAMRTMVGGGVPHQRAPINVRTPRLRGPTPRKEPRHQPTRTRITPSPPEAGAQRRRQSG